MQSNAAFVEMLFFNLVLMQLYIKFTCIAKPCFFSNTRLAR